MVQTLEVATTGSPTNDVKGSIGAIEGVTKVDFVNGDPNRLLVVISEKDERQICRAIGGVCGVVYIRTY